MVTVVMGARATRLATQDPAGWVVPVETVPLGETEGTAATVVVVDRAPWLVRADLGVLAAPGEPVTRPPRMSAQLVAVGMAVMVLAGGMESALETEVTAGRAAMGGLEMVLALAAAAATVLSADRVQTEGWVALGVTVVLAVMARMLVLVAEAGTPDRVAPVLAVATVATAARPVEAALV